MTFPIDIANYAETVLPIPAANRLPKTSHRLDAPSLHAINAAVAAERPLLLRGEPGTGKSQLARAAAVLLGRRFAWKVVDAHTEVADLFYTFDAVERLARAQTLGALRIGDDDSDEDALMRLLDERRFVRPGPLWWAFDPVGAGSQDECYRRRCSREVSAYTQPTPTPPQPQQGFVVLLDEIDKTDPSVPNGLLEALGQGTFHVPGLDEPISLHDVDGAKRVAPLVVITTNEERELPSAFVRRCLVLQLHVPADDGELRSWLLRRDDGDRGSAGCKKTRPHTARAGRIPRHASRGQGTRAGRYASERAADGHPRLRAQEAPGPPPGRREGEALRERALCAR